MKIGIDARFFGPRSGGGGIGRYVAELVTHLQMIDHRNEYILFLRKENFHECRIRNPRFYKQLVNIPWYSWKEQTELPREIRHARVDFMHFPHWNVPLFSKIPFLVTIHDLILLEDPESAHSTTKGPLIHGIKYAAFRTVLEHAVKKSRHILTISKYSRASILKHFRVRPEKITVIPNGVLPPERPRTVSLTQLGVYEPYFLYVGNAYPHKNPEMMMHAFRQFTEHDHQTQLVIAGRRDPFSQALEKEAEEIGIPKHRLRFVDLPTDEEIATLYEHAALFIFPSRLEGFGIPPLEAMSHGVPVACSSASSLPEVCGNAAAYFHPDDIETLSELMQKSVKEPTYFTPLVERGFRRAKLFTWEETAKKILDVYERFFYL